MTETQAKDFQFVKVESSHVDTNMIQDIARMDPQDKEPTNLIQDIEKMGLQGKGATPPDNPPNSTVLGSPQGQENPKASRSGRIIKKPKRFQEEEPEAPPKTKTGRRTHLGLLRAAILMILIFPISIPPSSANSIPVNLLCPPTFDKDQIAQMSTLLPSLSAKWMKSLKVSVERQFDLMDARPVFRFSTLEKGLQETDEDRQDPLPTPRKCGDKRLALQHLEPGLSDELINELD